MRPRPSLQRIADRTVRRLVPSVPVLSRRRGPMRTLNAIDRLVSLPFPEFRNLPPNHLRIRVGVGNRMLFNQPYYLGHGAAYVVELMAAGLLSLDHDVVDIGCGCGRLAHALRRFGFRGTYVGVDVDPEHIEWSAANFEEPRYRFVLADVYSEVYNPNGRPGPFRLPVPDGGADVVLGHSLFTHLLEDDLRGYVSESQRVLRSGGAMFMGVFCRDDLLGSDGVGGRWTFRHPIGNAHVENLRYPEAAVAYDREFLLATCADVGFASSEVAPSASQSVLIARQR